MFILIIWIALSFIFGVAFGQFARMGMEDGKSEEGPPAENRKKEPDHSGRETNA